MGFKRPGVQIAPLGPNERPKSFEKSRDFGLFRILKLKTKTPLRAAKFRLTFPPVFPDFSERVRDFPQIIDRHVLVIPQHFAGCVADQFELVLFGSLHPLH